MKKYIIIACLLLSVSSSSYLFFQSNRKDYSPLVFGLNVVYGTRTTFPIPLAEATNFDLSLTEETAKIDFN